MRRRRGRAAPARCTRPTPGSVAQPGLAVRPARGGDDAAPCRGALGRGAGSRDPAIRAAPSSSGAAAQASGVGQRARNDSQRPATRATCVCCSITSLTRIAHGSAVARHGRSCRPCISIPAREPAGPHAAQFVRLPAARHSEESTTMARHTITLIPGDGVGPEVSDGRAPRHRRHRRRHRLGGARRRARRDGGVRRPAAGTRARTRSGATRSRSRDR